MKYVKSLFTNIQKHKNMLKISLVFKLQGEITREFLGIRMRHFQGIVFICTKTYREILSGSMQPFLD